MKDFTNDDQVPPYAILSHTWDEEEVNFQQWHSMEISKTSSMKGYSKIKKFGKQAAVDGFDWVWADTYAPHYLCQCSWVTDETYQAAVLIRKVVPSWRKLLTQCFGGTRTPQFATSTYPISYGVQMLQL
jgi:hypothetical protein